MARPELIWPWSTGCFTDTKLSRTAIAYGASTAKVVDRATLVVGGRHLSETLDMIPRWWGALLVTSGPHGLQFKTMRRGRNNPHRDPRSLVELLWLDDAISLLTRRGATRGVRGKPRGIVWDRVCENFDVHEIAATVRAKLKARAAMQGSALLP